MWIEMRTKFISFYKNIFSIWKLLQCNDVCLYSWMIIFLNEIKMIAAVHILSSQFRFEKISDQTNKTRKTKLKNCEFWKLYWIPTPSWVILFYLFLYNNEFQFHEEKLQFEFILIFYAFIWSFENCNVVRWIFKNQMQYFWLNGGY